MPLTPTRLEVCATALADLFRDAGEVLASPMGPLPTLAVRLARRTFAPDLLMTDGVASLVTEEGVVEGWMPYTRVFDVVWSGRRHVIMGASQVDRYGNQNISAIGDHARPRVQLLGVRGAPGNTVNHATSYWVPDHGPRTLVERVDFVCGVGLDRAERGPFHDLRAVVTNLAVLGPGSSGTLELVSVHPGVSVEEVVAATGFALEPLATPTTRTPTVEELEILRALDPSGAATGWRA